MLAAPELELELDPGFEDFWSWTLDLRISAAELALDPGRVIVEDIVAPELELHPGLEAEDIHPRAPVMRVVPRRLADILTSE